MRRTCQTLGHVCPAQHVHRIISGGPAYRPGVAFIAAVSTGKALARWLVRVRVSMRLLSLSLSLALDGSVHTERTQTGSPRV
jgi:hypothetical protein